MWSYFDSIAGVVLGCVLWVVWVSIIAIRWSAELAVVTWRTGEDEQGKAPVICDKDSRETVI